MVEDIFKVLSSLWTGNQNLCVMVYDCKGNHMVTVLCPELSLVQGVTGGGCLGNLMGKTDL